MYTCMWLSNILVTMDSYCTKVLKVYTSKGWLPNMFTFTTTQNIYKSGLAKVYFHYYTKDLQSGAHPCILELEVNKWLFTGADVDPALQMPFPRVGHGLTRPWKWILENKKKVKVNKTKQQVAGYRSSRWPLHCQGGRSLHCLTGANSGVADNFIHH